MRNKPIKGWEDLYLIYENGDVWSVRKGKVMSPSYTTGYAIVKLQRGSYYEYHRVHRLVAEHFIPNPDNLPQVNHKDENPKNNCVDNLEWCNAEYNNAYGTRLKRVSGKMKGRITAPSILKKVNQYSKDGAFIKTWDSISDAARALGKNSAGITHCCKGDYNTSYGYIWRYYDGKDEE